MRQIDRGKRHRCRRVVQQLAEHAICLESVTASVRKIVGENVLQSLKSRLPNSTIFELAKTRGGRTVRGIRIGDGRELWKARHQGIRSDGGLPLSPVSAAVSSFEATRFHLDDDITASLTDDVVRRLIATLPDTR